MTEVAGCSVAARRFAADTGQIPLTYTPELNSPSHEALNLLASWTTPDHAQQATVPAEEEG